jgi:hypothetical protein
VALWCLLSMLEALGSIFSTAKQMNKQKLNSIGECNKGAFCLHTCILGLDLLSQESLGKKPCLLRQPFLQSL